MLEDQAQEGGQDTVHSSETNPIHSSKTQNTHPIAVLSTPTHLPLPNVQWWNYLVQWMLLLILEPEGRLWPFWNHCKHVCCCNLF